MTRRVPVFLDVGHLRAGQSDPRGESGLRQPCRLLRQYESVAKLLDKDGITDGHTTNGITPAVNTTRVQR